MDSPITPSQQLPQQPSPMGAYPQSPTATQQQNGDPSGNDFEGTSTAPQPQSPPPAEPAQNAAPEQPAADQQPVNTGYLPNESALIPGMSKPQPEEILFEWQSLSRPYKARNRQYFTTIGLIAALVALILLFAGQMFSVAVIAAVIFVIYVLNTTPPGMVTHKLTTYGIRVENNLYYWEEMGRFWFTEKFGENILNIEISRFPNRLTLLLGTTVAKEDMTLILSEVLLNQQPAPTAYEKAAKWLQEKLPIDIES